MIETPDARTDAVSHALDARRVRHAVLGRDEKTLEDTDGAPVDVVPASLAKGLEYDHVVVVEPAAIVDGEPSAFQGLRRLYVVLTRATQRLVTINSTTNWLP